MSAASGDAGFTLVEALVALAVLAVASAGLVRATEAHVDTIRALRLRAIAQWVGENRLVELGLEQAAPPAGETSVEMLGERWTVRVAPRPSADADLAVVEVSVRADGSLSTLATLTGFVDTGGAVR
jgi:general secretion pathway protein I